MAIPTFIGEGSLATVNAGGPPAVGDFILAVGILDGNDGLSIDQNIHCPADWHRVGAPRGSTSVGMMFWKIWASGDATGPTFTWASGRSALYNFLTFRGVDQARPIARQSIRRYSGATTLACLAETTPVADCLALAIHSITPGLAAGTPAGWTARYGNGNGSPTTTGTYQQISSKGIASAGTDTGTAGTTTAAAADVISRIVILQPPQTPVHKDVRVRTGFLLSPTSTGNQDITGFGFDVKALIVYCANIGSDVSTADVEFMRGIGADDGVNTAAQRSAGIWHDSGTSNEGGYSDSASIVKMYFAGNLTLASPNLEAQYSRISGGFRLNWTAVQASGVRLNWIAIGGADFQAVVGAEQVSTSPVTGLPWRPDLVHTLSQGLNSDSDQIRAASQLSAGWINTQTAAEFCFTFDMRAGGQPNFLIRDDSFLTKMSAGATVYQCEFEQTASDGFSWAQSSTDYFWYLAMYFGNNTAFPYDVETFDGEAVGTTNGTQQVPRFAVGQTTATKQAMLAYGSTAFVDQDATNGGYVEGQVGLFGESPYDQSSLGIAKNGTGSTRRCKPSDGLLLYSTGSMATLGKVGQWTDSRTITWTTNTTARYLFGLVTIGTIGTVHGSASDSVAVTDSAAEAVSYHRITSDTAVVTDTVRSSRVIAKTISDTIVVTDSATKTRVVGRVTSDTVAVTDALTSARSIAKTVSDTVAVADTLSRATSYSKTANDTVAVTDAVSVARVVARTISDTIAVTDASVRTALSFYRAPADAISVVDSVSVARVVAKTLSDTISVTDAVSAGYSLAKTISDTIEVSDAISSARSIAVAQSDVVAVTDALSVAMSYAIALADSVSVSDAVGRSISEHVETTEAIIVVDSLSVALTLGRRVDDDVAVIDSVVATGVFSYAVIVANTVSVEDEIIALLDSGLVSMSGTDDAASGQVVMYSVESTGRLQISGDPSSHRIGSVFVKRLGDFIEVTDQIVATVEGS